MRRLSLTFDNGPVAGGTGLILDLLARRGLKAIFFLVGDRLADPAARREAERAHGEGHWIGNHTMTHSGPLGERTDAGHAQSEIAASQEMLGALSHPDRLFRPVGGGGRLGPHVLSREAADHLIANRYTVVTWNNVPRDWVKPGDAWVERAQAQLAQQDWTVLVLHDHCLAGMIDTLDRFLDHAEGLGIEVVQDFPDSCVPLRCGVDAGLEGLTTPA